MSLLERLIPNFINPNFWRKTWTQITLSASLMRDRRVPLLLKLLPIGVVLYLISPIDLIPGIIPVFGQLDDLGLLLIVLAAFIRLAPDDVVREHQALPVLVEASAEAVE